MAISAERGSVAVIIPTLGRHTLSVAVRSALSQDPPPGEVVIVVDGPDAGVVPPDVAALSQVSIVVTGGGRGAGGARMDGVRASTAPLVAFLDDDDEWLPGKLAAQLEMFDGLHDKAAFPVVSCRAYVHHGGTAKERAPARALRAGEPLAPFMFNRNKLLVHGFMMGSSTLLTSRSLLEVEPWAEQIRLHEDWEWLLRVAARDDATVAMHPEPLINYFVQSPERSTSQARNGWRESLVFADRAGFDRRTRGDFLLCVTAAIALAHGDRANAARVALHAFRTARPGVRAWAVIALQTLVPHRLLGHVAGLLRTWNDRLSPTATERV